MRKLLVLLSLLVAVSFTIANAEQKPPPEPISSELQSIMDNSNIEWQSPITAVCTITSYFGMRKDPFGSGVTEFHKGVDLAAFGKRVVIRAMADGVISDHWPPPGYYGGKWFGGHTVYGGCIVIAHLAGIHTLYGHMKETFVHEGQKVHKGDAIGIMGDTGYATGPHLHLGVFIRTWSDTGVFDQYIDPLQTVLKGD